MSEDELFDSYRHLGYSSPGGELWLPYEPALRFIDDCERLGFVILGADFVIHDRNGIMPVAMGFADYSELLHAENGVEESARELRTLIRDGFPDEANKASIVIARPEAT